MIIFENVCDSTLTYAGQKHEIRHFVFDAVKETDWLVGLLILILATKSSLDRTHATYKSPSPLIKSRAIVMWENSKFGY